MAKSVAMRGPRRARGFRIAIGAAIAAGALALGAGPAAASTPPEYNSIPATLPGNVVSFAFEANGAVEFGDYIALGGTERASQNVPVTIVMSSWGCQTGGDASCLTTPGATWKQSLTLTIYNVVESSGNPPAVGSVVLTTTQDFNIPFRPSYDPINCPTDGTFHKWWSASASHCYNGLAHPVTFLLPVGKVLPDELIWGLAFNTQHYGSPPVGAGGPWNSLNVGSQTFDGAPYAGTDVEPDGAFVRKNGGAFGDDTGWTASKPLACFGTTCPQAAAAPTPTPTPAPIESVLGETNAPGQTPPPTSTGDTSGGHPGPTIALLLCSAFSAFALVVVAAQRRSIRR